MKKQKNNISGSVDYKAEKKSYTAPVVVDEILSDDGEELYVLENGNTIPKLRYDSMWKVPKNKILPKNYRVDLNSKFKI
jgi:hypothetical protein